MSVQSKFKEKAEINKSSFFSLREGNMTIKKKRPEILNVYVTASQLEDMLSLILG